MRKIMQWFYDLRIATKLTAAFVSVLVLTVLLGLFSIIQLARVNQNATDMENIWLPQSQTILQIRADLMRLRGIEQQYSASTVDVDMADYDRNIGAILKDFEKSREQYDRLVTDPEPRKVFERFKSGFAAYMEHHKKISALLGEQKNWDIPAVLKGEGFALSRKQVADDVDKLILITQQGAADAARTGSALYESARTWIVIALLVSVILGLFLALSIARIVSRPLGLAVDVARQVADGNLTASFEVTSRDETGRLMLALKDMNGSLTTIVGEVRRGTEMITTASNQIASGNLDLSARTEQQAGSLEETASSMEELTMTVRQNADNVKQANQLAQVASDSASKGRTVLQQAVDTMELINAASRKIVDIIGVIDGIAFQTNILALNAAVEAARAGEEGRGFAVVAGEVRTLAQRSAAAAKEIKSLIDDSVEKIDTGTRLVNQAGSSMAEIVAGVRHVTDIMGEINAASAEQASGIQQINQAITQMDDVTQHNAALVEEAAAAARSLQEQAGKLSQMISVFQLEEQKGEECGEVPALSDSLKTHRQ